MSNTVVVEYTSQRGNRLRTANVEAAAERFITPTVKEGDSYVNTVLFAKPKSNKRYKKVHPETFYIKAGNKK